LYQTAYHSEDISNYSFLITGGAGFIGSHIAQYLLKFGAHKVRVLDNFITGRKENVTLFENDPAYEFMEGDITDLENCRAACEGIDFVLHQAALGSVPRSVANPIPTNEHNVDGFLNMLIAARDANVKRFVFASSSSVYGDEPNLPKIENRIGNPLSPYAVTKYANELYAKVFYTNYGFETVGLRYFNIFGPRQDPNGQYAAVIPIFVDKILKKETVFINGDGEQTRDFTFVENAVQANIKAAFTAHTEALGTVFNIAFSESYTVNQLYFSIQKLLGSDHMPTYREPRQGDIQNSLADISKAKRLLDYKPLFSFGDGLKITVDFFR
jgi:UDP-N-acetylglucosamine 4-epimerase